MTLTEVWWAVLPALLVLVTGVVLPLVIAHWLRMYYGRGAIIAVGVLVLVVVGMTFVGIMDGPFP